MRKWVYPKNWLIALIRFYQKHISARTKAACRFTPTCSAYAIEALQKHGAVLGSALAVWRILRCNPLCRGGYDPVPEKISFPWRRNREK